MKKLFLILSVLVSTAASAQGFEGTITWSLKYEITDPKKKAEMEKHQKEMSDPANQEKMKKMQEQMNTPEMKAMMDANPQMKARMETAMKAMQGGDMGSILPQNFIVKIKGNNSITKMEGGMMAMEMLYLQDKNQAYSINRSAKTFTVIPSNAGASGRRTDSVKHTITKTSETMKVLNYNCTKYIVEFTTENGTTLTQNIWATTEIKGLDMRAMAKQKMGNSGQSFYYEGIAGVPLRVEMNNPQMNSVMEVTDIKKESLPADDFTIPADFKETKGVAFQ